MAIDFVLFLIELAEDVECLHDFMRQVDGDVNVFYRPLDTTSIQTSKSPNTISLESYYGDE